MATKELKVKTIISPSAIPGADFVINPYGGCLHACIYCYARFMKRFMNESSEWGQFCYPKINAVELVTKEIQKIPERSSIMFSSVTDAYNPLERKYELTKKTLEILANYNMDVSILTKSDLVLRDLDILKKMRQVEVGFTITTTHEKIQKIPERSSIMFSSVTDAYNPLERKYELTRKILKILADYNMDINILTKSDLILRDLDILKKIKHLEAGFTITTTNEKYQKILEPGASSPQKRIEAIKILKQAGISTFAFIGPILPYFADLENIFQQLSGMVEYVFVDTFNTKGANWDGVMNVLKKYFPNLIEKYKEIYLNEKNYRKYVSDLRTQIQELSKKYNVPVKIVFR